MLNLGARVILRGTVLLQKLWETTKGLHVVVLWIYSKELNQGCALQHLANMHLINKSCLMDLGTTTSGIWCLHCLCSLWVSLLNLNL